MKKESLYQRIQQDIRTKILDGTYTAGHQLLPENQLAEHYDVSRITIRNAMDNLVSTGLVERIRGRGTFVVDAQNHVGIRGTSAASTTERRISVIIPNLGDLHTIAMFKGIYGEAEAKGHTVTIYETHQDQKAEEWAISESLKGGVEGVVIYPIQGEMYNEEIIKLALSRFPAVLIDRSLDGININSVVTNNEAAAYNATSHLLSQGHTNIALITPNIELAIPLRERYRGYLRAHEEAGVEPARLHAHEHEELINGMSLRSSDRGLDMSVFEQVIRENPGITAFLCSEPLETKVLMTTLMNLGKRIPDDVSLIGFDDIENAELFTPPPTVVRQRSGEIGRRAFAIMEQLIAGNQRQSESIRLDADLIIRESVRAI